ncbi:MAG: HNH endonuclease, partial [Geminocystis sp. GBBB08]|nr:HNH endonuclease [Geminocystis sp. GBBB08]
NRPENLVALCNSCHLEYHRGGKSNISLDQLSLNL